MHLPFGPAIHETEEHAKLPEIVPIEELSERALIAAAREIDEEPQVPAEAS